MIKKILKTYGLHIAWFQALVAMLGSLYFSEVMHLMPCLLCWYQRILMYPLVLILAIAIWKRDKLVHLYALPLSIIGICIATFHYLVQKHIIPESLAPCVGNVSCTTKYIEYFGFITIPFLSLCGFVLITACIIAYKKLNASHESGN